MNIWIWVGIGGFAFLIFLLIGVFLFFKMKGRKKYPFIVYSRDGRSSKTIHARIKVDEDNKRDKMFVFDELDSSLEIREPTRWHNSIGYREVTYTRLGDFGYVKNEGVHQGTFEFDSKEDEFVYTKQVLSDDPYIHKSLEPEEKSLALLRIKEFHKRYEDPMNKQQAIMMVANFILIFILIVGVVYTSIAFANNADEMVVLAKENNKGAEIVKGVVNQMHTTTQILAQIASAQIGEANITRQIS